MKNKSKLKNAKTFPILVFSNILYRFAFSYSMLQLHTQIGFESCNSQLLAPFLLFLAILPLKNIFLCYVKK